MAYRIGIDAGSKTLKLVALDESGKIVYSTYRRHRTNIKRTLEEALHDLVWHVGDFEAMIAVTGSAGIEIAGELGVPFVQEVIATTHIVQATYPDADAVIELGGEDAKIIYLSGGLEQRMNATCAGGTGGFIDTIAFMLGVHESDMGRLAQGARQTFPVASRCAVFAQTDVRPLINAGVSKADIAASTLDAVVRQVLGGLACGRPVRGTVVFLGGPLEHIPYLVHAFRTALGLDTRSGIKPKDAHLLTACGAAILSDRHAEGEGDAAAAEKNRLLSVGALERQLHDMGGLKDDLAHLGPLFEDEDEIEAFRSRHAACAFPRERLFDARGELYLGVDAGSTTVKLAVLDQERNLVHSAYEPTQGDVVKTLQRMLVDFLTLAPRPYSAKPSDENPYVWIGHATATGYGEDLIRAAFGIDSGIVETVAHLRAAQHICPQARFVLDIGGQDMKAIWIRNGQIRDIVLNEACSSGCGAFIEGTAHALKSTPQRFTDAALHATSPVDLGTKCTVFMTSRVRHAQKIGATLEDIAAGTAYSVVQNALYRIIGAERVSSMGDHIVVQGGAFKSDAVLRAFELVSGREVMRCEQAHLMGAIGAALVAAERADSRRRPDEAVHSGLITREAIADLSPAKDTVPCTGCENACMLSVVDFGGGRVFVGENKCDRGLDEPARIKARIGRPDAGCDGTDGEAAIARSPERSRERPPNMIALEQRLVRPPCDMSGRDADAGGASRPSARGHIGLMNTIDVFPYTPFWHRLLTALGFDVVLPTRECEQRRNDEAWESVPSESVCYPAKISHLRYFDLCSQGVDAVFMPCFERNGHCPVACGYARALKGNVDPGATPIIACEIASFKPDLIAQDEASRLTLLEALAGIGQKGGRTGAKPPLQAEDLARAIKEALGAQHDFQQRLADATDRALDWIHASPERHGILVAGRPYHIDETLMHGMDKELRKLGFAVLGTTGLSGALSREDVGRYGGARPWKPAKPLLRAASYVIDDPQIDLVCLQSFGCGYDAMSVEDVLRALDGAGRPATTIKIDDISDLAHVRIRLRTLAEAVESQKRLRQAKAPSGAGDDSPPCAEEESQTPPTSDAGEPVALLAEPLDAYDLEIARRDTANDVCFTARIMAARAIRLVRENPGIGAVTLPEVCKDCLVDGIGRMIERATGAAPDLIWESTWRGGRRATDGADPVEDGAGRERPLVGIVGNALLCFEPFMNDGIVERIAGLGCTPVLPRPELVAVEDVRYLDQLEAFDGAGVRDVVYLQSFGCLKGHVESRGALRELRRLFPQMRITVIDFDPEASALNRENRLRLAVEAASADFAGRDDAIRRAR